MSNELDTNLLVTADERLMSLAIKAAAITITVAVVGMVSCSMHSNAYESDVTAEKVKIVAEEGKIELAKSKVALEKIQAMERMIDKGANPIAIRCMDKGWGNDNDVCLAVGVSNGKITSTDEF